MGRVTLAQAEADLAGVVERAADGEVVPMTRRGEPVVRVTAVEREPASPREPIDVEALRRLTNGMPRQDGDAGAWLRRERDEARY